MDIKNVSRLKDGVLDFKRKIRIDSKVNNVKYQKVVSETFNKHKGRIGIDKIKADINKQNNEFYVSVATCWRIHRELNLTSNSGLSFTKKRKYKKLKDTTQPRINLLNDLSNENLSDKRILSTDFCILKHNHYNHIHLLGAIDINTNEIKYLKISKNQSQEEVVKMLYLIIQLILFIVIMELNSHQKWSNNIA